MMGPALIDHFLDAVIAAALFAHNLRFQRRAFGQPAELPDKKLPPGFLPGLALFEGVELFVLLAAFFDRLVGLLDERLIDRILRVRQHGQAQGIRRGLGQNQQRLGRANPHVDVLILQKFFEPGSH